MSEFLSICIPTFNRCRYLNDLLCCFQKCFENEKNLLKEVKIFILDNNSSDNTLEVFLFHKEKLPLLYIKNEINIGADNNIRKSATTGGGQYTWILGDDELLYVKSLRCIIGLLKKYKPGLLINGTANYKHNINAPKFFNNYRDFVLHALKKNSTHLILAHTLISSNVFRSDIFDKLISEKYHSTHYGHMYGLIYGLINSGESVYLASEPTIIVRDERPAFEFPLDLNSDWITYSRWIKYFLHIENVSNDFILKNKTSLLLKIEKKINKFFVH